MKTLVVGFGNPMRSDDGVGVLAAEAIEKFKLLHTDVKVTQQLNIELAGELEGYDRVVLIDASESGPPVYVRRVLSGEGSDKVSSHHLHPGVLLTLAETVFGQKPAIFLCSIQGDNFEVGAGLSPAVQLRMDEAVSKLLALLQNTDDPNA